MHTSILVLTWLFASCSGDVISAAHVASWGGETPMGPRPRQARTTASVDEAGGTPSRAWSVEAAYEAYSIFLFRGVDLLGDAPIHQPHVIVGWRGLSAYYYGYFGRGADAGVERYKENDFGVEHERSFLDDRLSLTVGAVTYRYPGEHAAPPTWELYGIGSWDSYLAPTFAVWWDLDEYDGGYGQIEVSRSVDLTTALGLQDPRAVSLEGSAALGLDFGYNSNDHAPAFNDILLGVKLPLTMDAHVSVHVQAQRSIALSALDDIAQGNGWVLSFGGTYSF